MKINRINRRTFIASFILSGIPWIIIAAISNIGNNQHGTSQDIIFGIFTLLIFIAVIYWIITMVFISLFRVHDLGWHWIIVPIFGIFTPLLILLAIVPGQNKNNKYGNVPLNNFDLRRGLFWWQ